MVALIGRRNIACVIFVSLLVPFGMFIGGPTSRLITRK
jgi:hypothetical protein